jgi:ComF family protein
LKHNRDIRLAQILSLHFSQMHEQNEWPIDVVIPVPLSASRQRERGYNQAALLAYPFSLSSGLDYQPRALSRIRETPSQIGLTVKERQRNVHNAFWADNDKVFGRSILMIDDVMTTGATLNACAGALKAQGAGRIYALTLARTTADGIRQDNSDKIKETQEDMLEEI